MPDRAASVWNDERLEKLTKFWEQGLSITQIGIRLGVTCLLYTSPSPRDVEESRMPSSA